MTELQRDQFTNWYSYWLATGRIESQDAADAVAYVLAQLSGVAVDESDESSKRNTWEEA